jgi:hypothetical protein
MIPSFGGEIYRHNNRFQVWRQKLAVLDAPGSRLGTHSRVVITLQSNDQIHTRIQVTETICPHPKCTHAKPALSVYLLPCGVKTGWSKWNSM